MQFWTKNFYQKSPAIKKKSEAQMELIAEVDLFPLSDVDLYCICPQTPKNFMWASKQEPLQYIEPQTAWKTIHSIAATVISLTSAFLSVKPSRSRKTWLECEGNTLDQRVYSNSKKKNQFNCIIESVNAFSLSKRSCRKRNGEKARSPCFVFFAIQFLLY